MNPKITHWEKNIIKLNWLHFFSLPSPFVYLPLDALKNTDIPIMPDSIQETKFFFLYIYAHTPNCLFFSLRVKGEVSEADVDMPWRRSGATCWSPFPAAIKRKSLDVRPCGMHERKNVENGRSLVLLRLYRTRAITAPTNFAVLSVKWVKFVTH